MVLVSVFSSHLTFFFLTHSSVTSDISVLQFQFVNSYLSLFYIGFYLKDMERLKEVRRAHVFPEVAPRALIFITTRLQEHLFLHLYITHILLEFNRWQNMSNLQRQVGQKQQQFPQS